MNTNTQQAHNEILFSIMAGWKCDKNGSISIKMLEGTLLSLHECVIYVVSYYSLL